MKQNRKKRAFTLVEIVVVIAIIGILSAVLIPTFSGAIASARRAEVEAAGDALRKAYFSLVAEKGTEVILEYEWKYNEDYERLFHRTLCHGPFGRAELAAAAGLTNEQGVYLVHDVVYFHDDNGEAIWEIDPINMNYYRKKSYTLGGFLYIGDDYYSYYDAEKNTFETLPLSQVPPSLNFFDYEIEQWIGKLHFSYKHVDEVSSYAVVPGEWVIEAGMKDRPWPVVPT